MMNPWFIGPSRISRRSALLGLGVTAFVGAGCGRGQAGAVPVESAVMPLSRMGVDRFASRDQWQVLRRAFEAAAHDGFALQGDPDARYRHDGALTLAGVSFDGQGAHLVSLSDGPQVLRCIGQGWRLANLTLLGAATGRDPDNQKNGLLIGDHDQAPASDFTIEDVLVSGVGPGRGFAGAGIMFNNAHHGRILRARVQDSKADGFHVTNRSSDLSFLAPSSERTGDDGFAVVSYRSQHQPCHGIRVQNGTVLAPVGRGFSVVGGRDVRYENCRIERSAAAGVYFYGENDYDTFGVADCHLIAAQLRNCVTGIGMPPGFAHAAIMMGGREGSDTPPGGSLTRGATGCRIVQARIQGAGQGCFAGIALNQYAVGSRIDAADIRELLALRRDRQPNGIEIGGRDTVVTAPQMNGIAGTPIIVARSAAGTCMIDRAHVRRGRMTPSPTDSFNTNCYVDDAPALTSMTLSNSRFEQGPKRLTTNLLRRGKLRLTNNLLNGKAAS